MKSFAIGYDVDYSTYTNELKEASLASKVLGTNHYSRKINEKDLLHFIERMVWLQDEPISDPVCVPLYYVSKLAVREKVKVCQVGEGADELFIGYPFWRVLFFYKSWEMSSFLKPLKKLAKIYLNLTGKNTSWQMEYLKRNEKQQPIFWSGAEAFTDAQKSTYFQKSI